VSEQFINVNVSVNRWCGYGVQVEVKLFKGMSVQVAVDVNFESVLSLYNPTL